MGNKEGPLPLPLQKIQCGRQVLSKAHAFVLFVTSHAQITLVDVWRNKAGFLAAKVHRLKHI